MDGGRAQHALLLVRARGLAVLDAWRTSAREPVRVASEFLEGKSFPRLIFAKNGTSSADRSGK
jgi:hypothetical protein